MFDDVAHLMLDYAKKLELLDDDNWCSEPKNVTD
jgi:hypothetical protein